MSASKSCINRLQKEYRAILKVIPQGDSTDLVIDAHGPSCIRLTTPCSLVRCTYVCGSRCGVVSEVLECFRSLFSILGLTLPPATSSNGTTPLRVLQTQSTRVVYTMGKRDLRDTSPQTRLHCCTRSTVAILSLHGPVVSKHIWHAGRWCSHRSILTGHHLSSC